MSSSENRSTRKAEAVGPGIPRESDWFTDQGVLLDLARRVDRQRGLPPIIEGYEVLHELGHGGQGVVYYGIQRSTGRTVAIKVLRDSQWTSSSARRRFEREAELIARMRHPNIVRLFDAGITVDGRAYIVIELLRGTSLAELLRMPADGDDSADSRGDASLEPDRGRVQASPSPQPSPLEGEGVKPGGWPVERVLQMFCKICDAVRYAHQHGVIHRDLKPGNVLICESEPVIVDFGLARTWTGPDAGNDPSASGTETGRFVGSLAWASPEQACGRTAEIDTRTDVYSLGAILYQALTGHLPCETSGDFPTAIRNISELPPVPPSGLRRDIDNELETIILRCLAKEPGRRYQSADALGRDVERYLAGEPIEAKRDSVSYLLRKTIQRHKLVAALIGLLLGGLIAGGGILTWLYGRASAAERLAQEQLARTLDEKARSDAVKEFLKRVLGSTRLDYVPGRVRSFPELLAEASHRAGVELAEFPRVEAEVRTTIGGALYSLDRRGAAEEEFRKALAIQQKLLSHDDPSLADTQTALAATLLYRGAHAEAQPLLEGALATYLYRYGSDHPATGNCLLNIGKLLHAQRYHREAEDYCRRALASYEAVEGEESVSVARCLASLGAVEINRRNYDNAEGHLNRARRILEQLHGDEHPLLINVVCSLAELQLFRDDLPAAQTLIEHAHALSDRILGDGHLQTAQVVLLEAGLRRREGRLDDAASLYREVLRRTGSRGPHVLPIVPTCLSGLGFTLQAQGKYADAEAAFREALGIWQDMYPNDHPLVASGLVNLGRLLIDAGRPAEAEPLLRSALEIRRAIWEEDDEIVSETKDLLARCRPLGN